MRLLFDPPCMCRAGAETERQWSDLMTAGRIRVEQKRTLQLHTYAIGNESAPIQLARCRFPGLAIANAKILIYFSYEIYRSNFIKQHSETVMVWSYQNQCSRKRVQQLKKRKKSCFLKSEKNVKNVGLPPTYSFTGRSVTQFSTFRSLLTALLFTARCYAYAVSLYAFVVCPSLCPSQVGVLLKRLKVGSHIQHHTIAQGV